MRRIRRRAVTIAADESLFNRLEELRKQFKIQTGQTLNQRQLTRIIASNIKPIKINLNNLNRRSPNGRVKKR